MDKQVYLSKYDNSWYKPGKLLPRILWMLFSAFIFQHKLAVLNSVKIFLLRLFGAKIGNNVVIKPNVTIKYPWFIEIGSNVWIGENVWIDNLTMVTIADNVCISQGVYILTGNHNYKSQSFDLMVMNVILEEGVWLGAKAIVCPGVVCKKYSVLTVGSIATQDLSENTINQGNPSQVIRHRVIQN